MDDARIENRRKARLQDRNQWKKRGEQGPERGAEHADRCVMNTDRIRKEFLPGLVTVCVFHPTTMDPIGCDGLYVESVYVEHMGKFQNYCNHLGYLWNKFSPN